MYEIIKSVIQSGRYELTDILTKIDTLWVQSSLTDDERTELMNLARSGADPTQGVDVLAKLSDLDKAGGETGACRGNGSRAGRGISRVCSWKVVLQGRQDYIQQRQ